ncbi:MAG: RHS repeat protein [Leptolyngbya sp. SIO1E4]|nr:RHS repeat protein [Leptolyngbya sp. SIO1E4]
MWEAPTSSPKRETRVDVGCVSFSSTTAVLLLSLKRTIPNQPYPCAQRRLIARTDPNAPYLPSGATIEYQYDEAGNRTAVSTPNGSVAYTYDERNRLETVLDEDSLMLLFMKLMLIVFLKTLMEGTTGERLYSLASRLAFQLT